MSLASALLKANIWRLGLAIVVIAFAYYVYRWSGWWPTPESLQQMNMGSLAAVVIILLMAVAWAFALPASMFLFITPLLFPPHWSALITTTGCAAGAAIGYLVARFAGGSWIERYRDARLMRFLARHSSMLVLFGIRLTPSSPHGFINYAAGLARIPLARFLLATTAAMAIKSYVYAQAMQRTVGAQTWQEVLSLQTVLSLFGVALLAVVGHVLLRRYAANDRALSLTPERLAKM